MQRAFGLAVFLLLLAGGVYQLLRGRVATPAPTLLWYAGDLLGLWHGRRIEGHASVSRPAAGQAG